MRTRAIALFAAAAALFAAACSDDDDTSEASTTTGAVTTAATTSTTPTSAPPTVTAATTAAETTVVETTPPTTSATASPDLAAAIDRAVGDSPAGCDPVDASHCYLPFPSNAYTVDDASTPTGLRIALPADGAPVNSSGTRLDVAEWNRNDGFSPVPTILTHMGAIDPEASRLPSWTDLEASLADDASVVLIDTTDGGTRIPLWAELDLTSKRPADRLLVINPAIALTEGHTYAAAVRHLVGPDGVELPVDPVFQAYRDGLLTDNDAVESRRPAMDTTLQALADAGIETADLQRAWDFTVASTENITSRMLHIRDETLATLDGAAPAFEVTDVIEQPEDGIARQIHGTYTVPNYLTGDGGPGQRFHYDQRVGRNPDALPTANGTIESPFMCNIPNSVADGDRQAHVVQYGHGLLGGQDEINAGNVRDFGNEWDVVFCATKWAGMSEDDVSNAVTSLGELSNFPTMVDRMQQGFLNQIVLGRLMIGDDGLATHPEFQRPDGTPLIDTSSLTYDGNSQGGIMGLALAAVSPDLERAVLGVPGMNYSLLLSRSIDWTTYESILKPAYPDASDRTLLISLIQMLWDRGEGAGYVNHVTTDPLPGTPATDVLLHVAFGDQQVTELSAMVEARSLGIPIHRPLTDRMQEFEPGWGLDSIDYPSSGSGIVIWDSGAAQIPIGRTAPRRGEDPHEDPRANAHVRRQKAAFLFEGELRDVCNGVCHAEPVD